MSISVVIPHYNQSNFLKAAIDSIIEQTYPANEIIVIDDASNEDLNPLLNSHGQYLRFIQQSKAGTAAARNLGIQHATGEYLAFLDADDLWHPQKLAHQIQFLNQNPTHMVYGFTQNFLCDSLSQDEIKKLKQNLMTPMAGIAPSNFIIAKETLLSVGLMNESIKMGEFMDWYIRATKLGIQTKIIPQALVYRRIHAGHLGKSNQHQHYLKILHQKIKKNEG